MTDDSTNQPAPPTETAVEKVIRLEGELRDFESRRSADTTPEAPPTIFDHASDKKLSDELGQIFDKAEAKAERQDEAKTIPVAKARSPYGEEIKPSLDDAFRNTYDFLNASKAEQTQMRGASKLVEQVRENAKRFGITLDDQGAFFAAMDLERQQTEKAQNHEFSQGAEYMRSAFKDSHPSESARFFSETKSALDRDLVGGIAEIAQHYGAHPMQVAQMIAQRFGGQQGQPATQEMVNAVEAQVNRTASTLDNFDDHQEAVLSILQKGEVRRTGDYSADLKAAYNLAVKREAKLSPDDRLTRQLSRAYDRAQKRK
jgi:hypothetical protein